MMLSKDAANALADFVLHFGNFTDLVTLASAERAYSCVVTLAELPHALKASARFVVTPYTNDSVADNLVCVRAAPLAHVLKSNVFGPVILIFHERGLGLFEANSKQLLWKHSRLYVPHVLEVCLPDRSDKLSTGLRLGADILAALIWPHALIADRTTWIINSTHCTLRTDAHDGSFVRTRTSTVEGSSEVGFEIKVGTRHLCLLACLLDGVARVLFNPVVQDDSLDLWFELPHYECCVRLTSTSSSTN